MRRIPGILVLALLGLVPPPAGADAWRQTSAGWTSGQIDHVRTIPIEAGSGVAALLHGSHLYVTTFRSFSIYDASDPLDPKLLSTRPLPGQIANEQPQTNGSILLLTRDGTLDIWDVRDKTAPALITSMSDPRINHIWTCILDCAYAYGGRGSIVDLANPAAPKLVGDWTAVGTPSSFHTVREVKPGVVLTGSAPMYLLDARANPVQPVRLATAAVEQTTPRRPYLIIGGPPRSVPAAVAWPLGASDRFVLTSTESPFSGSCDANSGSFYTYDTAGWETRKTFLRVDELQITSNGTYGDGAPPTNVLGCSPYAFEPRPSYGADRVVAVSWFDHGTRLLRIDGDGKLSQIGGFLGAGGISAQPVWRTNEVLYVVDFNRGLDILHVEPTAPAAHVEDPIGDANGYGDGMRPASLDAADLVAARFETTYVSIPVGEDGIDHVPTGLRIHIRTRSAPRADAATIHFELKATIGACPSSFHALIRGPLAAPGEPAEGQATWRKLSYACPGNDSNRSPAGWTAQVVASEREMVLTLPFAPLTTAEAAVLGPGAVLRETGAFTFTSARGSVQVGTFFPGTIDTAGPGADWTIGSDVPPDVPCTRGCP